MSAWAPHPWVTDRTRRVRFGLFEPPGLDWANEVRRASLAEELGFDSYWTGDHPGLLPRDCWTTLTGLALATNHIRLGSLVSCVYYRGPALLARLAADVDRLSNGRLVLGIGAGNDSAEFAQLGLPFPDLHQRQQAVEETVQIVSGASRETTYTFVGQQFQVHDLHLRPGPLQRPRVPLLIAGGGERVTLRQVAQYADACNFGPSSGSGSAFDVESVRRKLDALRRHCADLDRPYDSVLRTHSVLAGGLIIASTESRLLEKIQAYPMWYGAWHSVGVRGTPEQVLAHYRSLAEAGVNYFIVLFHAQDDESIRLFAEHVIPAM